MKLRKKKSPETRMKSSFFLKCVWLIQLFPRRCAPQPLAGAPRNGVNINSIAHNITKCYNARIRQQWKKYAITYIGILDFFG